MKKSQFIAIIIMFAAASVLIWIGAFGKDNVKNGEPTASAGVNIKNTIKPIETPAASTPSEGNPGETTPGDPSGSSGNGTTDNPSASAAPSTPTPTQVPSKVTFPTVKNADFAGINNEFTYWSSRFKTGENNQNEPVFDDNIKKNIGDVDYIFLNGKSETEWEVFLTFSLNYDYGVTDKILNTLQS